LASRVSYTAHELRLINLFEDITSTHVIDCILEDDTIIFIIEPPSSTFSNILSNTKILSNMLRKEIIVVVYSEDPISFTKNYFGSASVRAVKYRTTPLGEKQLIMYVEPQHRGKVIGRGGRNAERFRKLVKRYFEISKVYIR